LESAPHVVGGVPAPSEIAAGVPGDLDALCRLTLNEDEGPLTPGDFATQIAPWAMSQVSGLGGTTPVDDGSTKTIALSMDQLRADLAGPPAPLPVPTPPTPATPQGDRAHGGDDAGQAPPHEPGGAPDLPVVGEAADGATDDSDNSADDIETRVLPVVGSPDGPGPSTGADAANPPTSQTTTGATVQRFDPPSSSTVEAPADDQPGTGAGAATQAAAAASAVGSALGTAGHAAGQAAGAAAQRVGSFARATADKAAQRRELRHAAEERAEQRRISLDQALVEGQEPLDPPLPMLPADTGLAPTRDQSKIVLAIVVVFLIVAIFFGYLGMSKIGSNTNLGLGDAPAPKGTVKVTAPAVTVTPTQPDDSGGSTFAVLGATGFDPAGDGAERNGEAPRVFDGKDNTFWSSEGYASANLGGLKKGVGVRLDLGQDRNVSTVKLVLPNASDVTVYVGDDRTSLDNAKQVGSSKGKSGAITLKAAAPVKGQYVFVWFTSVTQVSDGRFRATLAEVTVS
jgi:hypothetical protein